MSEPTSAIATTRIVPTPKPWKTRVPISSMPAIAAITVRPDTSTARPDVAAAISSAVGGRAALRPLLALAAQVEQRVVDADGQADQQDHRVDRLVDVQQVAEQRGQPERRHHRGQAEQQRDAGGDERAEGEHEDHERHRERGDLGLLEVLGEARR